MNAASVYDAYWASGRHVSPEWDDKQFRKVLAPLIGRQNVLDYGCGLGYTYQRHLAASVKNYTGADVGSLAVEDARRKGFGALLISPETGKIDAPADSFDGATCLEVMEHLFDPLQAAREIHRVMKPGGVLVATVPNFGYHAWRLLALLRAQVPASPDNPAQNAFNGVHIRFFSKLTFTRLLRAAGFVNVRIGSFDESNVWDVAWAAGPLGIVSDITRKHLPGPLRLSFLQDVWPNVFAYRLRAVAQK
jgi:SAM-dependent methyltransferase